MRAVMLVLITLMVSFEAHSLEPKHAIVVDSSGSMAGFYNTGSVKTLVVELQKILGGTKIYLFSDKGPELVGKADSLRSVNRDTRIDLAIEGLVKDPKTSPDVIWLITDNVQDRTETPYVDATVSDFYGLLRQDTFNRIFIIPCYLDFNGKVYLNREGHQYAEQYSGKKGLILYAILINGSYRKQFDDLCNRLLGALSQYQPKLLLAKPLDKETFDIRIADPPTGNEPANVRFTEKGIFYGKGFKEGSSIPLVFYIKLLSKFEDLIVSGKVSVEVVNNRLTGKVFRDTKVSCRIFPERVRVAPKKLSEEVYKVNINVDKVKIKRDPISILRAGLSGKPGLIKGRIRIKVSIPREGFRFTDDVLMQYNTQDILDFRRIFGMGFLINYMPVDVTDIPVEYDIILAINYPYWPLMVIVSFAIAFIAIIVVTYRVVSASERFAISEGGRAESIIALSPLVRSYKIYMSGVRCGSIIKSLSGRLIAKANKGFNIDGMKQRGLNKEIDSFSIITNDGSNSVNVQIRSMKEIADERKMDVDDGF